MGMVSLKVALPLLWCLLLVPLHFMVGVLLIRGRYQGSGPGIVPFEGVEKVFPPMEHYRGKVHPDTYN